MHHPRDVGFLTPLLITTIGVSVLLGTGPHPIDDEMDDGGMMTMESALDEIETPTPDELEFFESKIRPVLIENCYDCHSADADRIRGGFTLDTRHAIRQALTPGDPDDSLIIQSIRYDDEYLQMPPRGKLPDGVIRDLETWVRMGAPDPRGAAGSVVAPPPKEIDIEDARRFWSFVMPVSLEPPAVEDERWPRTDLDRFVLSSLEERDLKPVRDADKETLIRRLTFDLTGLPPTPADVEAFVRDRSADAYDELVERLLASPQFGERWGRHWLDVARYAESSGRERNVFYPHAWRYRDYVIDSFNADKPFDEFLREQVAGDLLPAHDDDERAAQLVATGFLAIGAKSHNTRGRAQFAFDVADEQIDAMSQGMLGMTFSCARCHDHKFDPISSRDYYALAGIFLSSETCFGGVRSQFNRQTGPLLTLPEGPSVEHGASIPSQQLRTLDQRIVRLERQIDELAAEARGSRDRRSESQQRLRLLRSQLDTVAALRARYDDDGRPVDLEAMGMRDAAGVRDAQLLVRGELDQASGVVPRGLPEVLVSDSTSDIARRDSGRLVLADWIASDDNPLTARVWTNRVWLHLFGQAIVPTPDNFGHSGIAPTNPELLDHLAVRFMSEGWSTKTFIRYVVSSRAYRMSSQHNTANYRVDPDNEWYWRMSPKRLEGEAIRDAMLAASGELDLARPAGSPIAALEGGVGILDRTPNLAASFEKPHRSVYLPVIRERVPEALEVFDFAEPAFVTGDRDETNVATQALYLLNNEFVITQARTMAERLLAMPGSDVERVRQGFLLAFGRDPSASELSAVTGFFQDFPSAQGDVPTDAPPRRRGRRFRNRETADPHAEMRALGWTTFCQSLFASAEFRYVN